LSAFVTAVFSDFNTSCHRANTCPTALAVEAPLLAEMHLELMERAETGTGICLGSRYNYNYPRMERCGWMICSVPALQDDISLTSDAKMVQNQLRHGNPTDVMCVVRRAPIHGVLSQDGEVSLSSYSCLLSTAYAQFHRVWFYSTIPRPSPKRLIPVPRQPYTLTA
jgi:hypothetical protein